VNFHGWMLHWLFTNVNTLLKMSSLSPKTCVYVFREVRFLIRDEAKIFYVLFYWKNFTVPSLLLASSLVFFQTLLFASWWVGHRHFEILTLVKVNSFYTNLLVFISNSVRLLSLMRMHRSTAYTVKSFMLSSLSRRLSKTHIP